MDLLRCFASYNSSRFLLEYSMRTITPKRPSFVIYSPFRLYAAHCFGTSQFHDSFAHTPNTSGFIFSLFCIRQQKNSSDSSGKNRKKTKDRSQEHHFDLLSSAHYIRYSIVVHIHTHTYLVCAEKRQQSLLQSTHAHLWSPWIYRAFAKNQCRTIRVRCARIVCNALGANEMEWMSERVY